MHDWWIALVAAAFGKIDYIETPTVLYRQHSRNDTGANKWGINYIASRILNHNKIKEYILTTQLFKQKSS